MQVCPDFWWESLNGVRILKWHRVAPASEILLAGRHLFSIGNLRLAVFHVNGLWFAIDNHCPHRGGPIAAGQWDGQCITCPWHGAQFDISTGQPLTTDTNPLTTVDVRLMDGYIEVDLDCLSVNQQANEDGIQRVVVRYGRGADVGLFGSIHAIPCQRGDQVVVQSFRGMEIGTVLQSADSGQALRGELLRIASKDDLVRNQQCQSVASDLLNLAVEKVARANMPVQLVDVDLTLDGDAITYYFLGADTAGELGPIAVRLGQEMGKRVRFRAMTT